MASSARDAAIEYASHVFVLPLRHRQKVPSISAWPDNATDDPAVINQWFDQQPEAGVGLLMGPTPDGLFMIAVDEDEHDPQKSGSKSMAKLEADNGALPDTVTADTPTGGRHRLFYSSIPISKSSGRLGPGIDIQGLNSFIVAAPSIHPNGREYRWRPGHELGEHPIAFAPQWLIDLASAPEPTPTPQAPQVRDDFWSNVDDSPADRFNQATTWEELLTEAGFTPHHRDRTGECHWTRPGKDRSDGSSLTTGYQGLDVACVFTKSLSWLPEGTYSKFKFAAHLRHNGDMSAMAKEVLSKERVAIPATNSSDPWDTPDPLIPIVDTPPFPVQALPEWITSHVHATAYNLQVDAALPACLALGALSTVTISKLHVLLEHQNWNQPANLYIVVAMDPSAGKSPAKKAMFDAVEDIERVRMNIACASVIKQESVRSVWDKKMKRVQDTMAKSSGDDYRAAEAELMDLIDERTNQEQVADGRLLVDDCTTEALAKVMHGAGGAIAQVSAEGGLFDRIGGIYNDGQANLDLQLEGWGGGRFQQDRITRESIVIQRANLVIVCTVQPSVLDDIGANRAMNNRGLIPRFLISTPPSNVGYRNRRQTSRTNPTVATAYAAHLRDIHDRCRSRPVNLVINDEAANLYMDWDQGLEDQLRPGGNYDLHAQFIGKLRANVLRIAALLHVAHGHDRNSDRITLGVMQDAITIADYFLRHTMALHERWGTDEAHINAQAILEWAVRNGHQKFTRRDLTRALRRRFPSNESTVEPLKRLIETGWLRASGDVTGLSTNSRGTPSLALTVHPDAHNLIGGHGANTSVGAVSVVAPKDVLVDNSLSLEEETSLQRPPGATTDTHDTDPIRRSGLFDPEP